MSVVVPGGFVTGQEAGWVGSLDLNPGLGASLLQPTMCLQPAGASGLLAWCLELPPLSCIVFQL